jgi:hypothetical protein
VSLTRRRNARASVSSSEARVSSGVSRSGNTLPIFISSVAVYPGGCRCARRRG